MVATDTAPRPYDAPLLRACRRERLPRPPVWFMRQAGRSLPEYRAIRSGISMLDSCRRPDLVAEITLQPVRRYGVDAAILYSDIMVPLLAVGVDVDIVAGTGPVLGRPVRSRADLGPIGAFDEAAVPYVAEAVRLVVRELGDLPLIGFAGAPFTLASYLVEGGPSRDHAAARALMRADPALWDDLLTRLADLSASFLAVQVRAGARAVQLFDSWAGWLAPADYARFALPYSRRVLRRIGALGVPRIHFAVGAGELLAQLAAAGAEVVGVDWRVPLDVAADRIGAPVAVQGNLDPTVLLGPWAEVERAVRDVVRRGRAAAGHVFNLGHGVLPQTDPDMLARVVDLVHAIEPAEAGEPSAATQVGDPAVPTDPAEPVTPTDPRGARPAPPDRSTEVA